MLLWEKEGVAIFRSALYQTISTVVVTEDAVLVSDPSWLPHEIEEIRRYVLEIRGERPLYMVLTHSDFDHILGAGAFPEATIIASEALAFKGEAQQQSILEQIHAFDDDYYISRPYPVSYPRVDEVVTEEGQQLELGGTTLTFYHAPGHNDDGIFTLVEPLGLWLAGDYLSDIEFPYIYHNSRQYESTIGKLDDLMQQHEVRLLIPGHGQPTCDREEMRHRQQKDQAYIGALRAAILRGDDAGIEALIADCPFPRNMSKFHRANRLLIERELGRG
ncbi:MBL fold metallo-hydrolase [Paenibacillus sp. SYP-B4298]|uniref:MBL fold metallo-hydrolase n=1 Tax=Paenibacillus sp. SYP-B4298 TaxID=2996034 RepID=UPI0022DE4B91|nr:MBL fold metallo-hydrolase [Paenibacillus sp. SYP-B4298]